MKIRTFFLLFLITPVILIVSQCTKKEMNMVGSEFLDRENMGSEHFAMFYPTPADTFFNMPISTAEGASLFFGDFGSLKTRTLFRLRETDLPKGGVVDSVKFTLFYSKIHGDTSNVSNISMNQISNDWSQSDISWDDFENNALLGEKIEYTELKQLSDRFTFKLPDSLMQSWIDSTTADDNYGFTLSYESPDTGAIVQCYSYDHTEASLKPQIALYVHVDTTNLQYILTISDDTYIAQQPQDPTSDFLYISNCNAIRSYLNFDLSAIPDNATINLAICTLRADTLKSWPDNKEFPLLASSLEEPFHLPPDLDINLSDLLVGNPSADSMLINISQYVQNWTSGVFENHGFILTGLFEDRDIGKRAYYSSTADSSLIPRLDVYYSLPPSSRF